MGNRLFLRTVLSVNYAQYNQQYMLPRRYYIASMRHISYIVERGLVTQSPLSSIVDAYETFTVANCNALITYLHRSGGSCKT